MLEQQAREDEEKLKALQSLASEAFRELDQGLGISIASEEQLAELIGQLGQRAAEEAK